MTLELPDHRSQHWRDALPGLLEQETASAIHLDCGDWNLTCTDLQQLLQIIDRMGLSLRGLRSRQPQTVVSAAALGLEIQIDSAKEEKPEPAEPTNQDGLLVHRGTLRSGDHLQNDGDVLVYGDVNPGARVSAGGDVMVWGRLRGIAHAGCLGDTQARIVALQLRPVQLRIANAVARGPEDQPLDGQAEQARLQQGAIVIEPAKTGSSR